MKRYYVVTPPVGYVDVIVDGQGPYYEESDVIEIEAASKKDAIALAVKLMLKDSACNYCKEQRMDGCSPYTGIKAYEAKELNG